MNERVKEGDAGIYTNSFMVDKRNIYAYVFVHIRMHIPYVHTCVMCVHTYKIMTYTHFCSYTNQLTFNTVVCA